VKRSNVSGMRRNERVLLSCDKEGTYRNRNAKNPNKKGARGTGSKKCSCPLRLKDKELSNTTGWVLMIVSGIHNHYLAENLEGHSFRRRREISCIFVEDTCSAKRHFEYIETKKVSMLAQ